MSARQPDWNDLYLRDPEAFYRLASTGMDEQYESEPEPYPVDLENRNNPASGPETRSKKVTDFERPNHWKRLDVAEINTWNCPPLVPIVEGMIAHGNFVFVAAQTQVGKTLFALYLGLKLINGGRLFDRFKIHPVRKILYFGLEDPERRFQARLLDYGLSLPTSDQFIIEYCPGLKINDDAMFNYFQRIVTEEKADFVFLDTYQKSTPGISSFNDEQQSIILHRLANLTRESNVTLTVLDHLRKSDNSKNRSLVSLDDVKGTGGKIQNADCTILLERSGSKQIKFQCRSKDFDEHIAILLNVSPQNSGKEKFTYAAELSPESNKQKAENTRNKILETLSTDVWVSPADINVDALSKATIRRHLDALLQQRLCERQGSGRATKYRKSAHTEGGGK